MYFFQYFIFLTFLKKNAIIQWQKSADDFIVSFSSMQNRFKARKSLVQNLLNKQTSSHDFIEQWGIYEQCKK